MRIIAEVPWLKFEIPTLEFLCHLLNGCYFLLGCGLISYNQIIE